MGMLYEYDNFDYGEEFDGEQAFLEDIAAMNGYESVEDYNDAFYDDEDVDLYYIY